MGDFSQNPSRARYRSRYFWCSFFSFVQNRSENEPTIILYLDNVIVMIHICYNCFLMGSLVFQSDLLCKLCVLQKFTLFLNSCQNQHFLRFHLTSSDQKSVTNFLKTQKDAINREISTIAFIFGATFHQTPCGCKVRAPQSHPPQLQDPVLKGLRNS